ncbi:MAG: hypothetical protein ACM3SQ_13380 [Betaproteobacteria bacterium]
MKTFASIPTFDDVNLILRLYEIRREARMRQARAWFLAKFKPRTWQEAQALIPAGSEENASYRMVTSHWEMVASFLTSGVLNRELFYQSGRELLVCWERMRDLVSDIRTANNNPLEFTNLERAAAAYVNWWTNQAPGAYEAFSRRVRG